MVMSTTTLALSIVSEGLDRPYTLNPKLLNPSELRLHLLAALTAASFRNPGSPGLLRGLKVEGRV